MRPQSTRTILNRFDSLIQRTDFSESRKLSGQYLLSFVSEKLVEDNLSQNQLLVSYWTLFSSDFDEVHNSEVILGWNTITAICIKKGLEQV